MTDREEDKGEMIEKGRDFIKYKEIREWENYKYESQKTKANKTTTAT